MKTILVVEDDALIRTLEITVLDRAGYRVLSAGDGVEGAVLFSREFEKVDLLVTDISLPGMRGPDLARFARSIRPDLKVLFASGSILMEDINPMHLVEGSSSLPKPFTAQELLGVVDSMLQAMPLPAVESASSVSV